MHDFCCCCCLKPFVKNTSVAGWLERWRVLDNDAAAAGDHDMTVLAATAATLWIPFGTSQQLPDLTTTTTGGGNGYGGLLSMLPSLSYIQFHGHMYSITITDNMNHES